MGLELHDLVDDIDQDLLSIPHTALIGLLVTAVLIVIRVAWVFPLVFLLRRRAGRAERRIMRLWLRLEQVRERPADPRQQRRRRLLARHRDAAAGWPQLRRRGVPPCSSR